MDRKAIGNGMTVSAQLGLDDFALLASQGVGLVINNRPDGEAIGQLTAADGQDAADRAGLAYRHIPVRLATLRPEEVDRFADALDTAPGPVHAHCASGHRSALLWALSQIRRGRMSRQDASRWAQEHQVDLAAAFAWLDRQPA